VLKQAVFLVGGRGTRLGVLTDGTPKPFITVAGRPFLSYLIDNAVRHGFDDILLLAGYRGDVLRAAWGKGSVGAAALMREGVRITIVEEPSAAGTAGALVHVRDRLDEKFLLANGDSFFDFNWLDLLTLDTADDWLARIALRQVPDGSRYGRVELTGERVTAFAARGGSGPALVNGGVYLLRRSVLDHVDRVPLSIEHDVFPRLTTAGRMYGRAYERFFIDIGVPEDLARADATLSDAYRRPAAFLDRDGVLNVDHGHVHRREDFDWVPGAKEAIKHLNDIGYFVFVITNQAGIAHGYYSEEDMHSLHRWVAAELQKIGAHIDRIEYCPDHPDGVVERYRRVPHRRKPAPGMILACSARWPVDCDKSFVIGDKQIDLDAARAANIAGYLFKDGNLFAHVRQILKQTPGQ
jgi:D,D-heptose 1,7-bisphosphate phosphatase